MIRPIVWITILTSIFNSNSSVVRAAAIERNNNELDTRASNTIATISSNAMSAALIEGQGILGKYSKCSGSMCNWMSKKSDSTLLTELSIPGTHDTASWDYTTLKQIQYLKQTGIIYPALIYRCQSTSIFSQLAAGNRAFDLRVGFSPTNTSKIIFYHSEAILDLQASFQDVLYGYYKFLQDNPTETLFLSVKIENSTWGTTQALQQQLYTTLSTSTIIDQSTSLSSRPLSSFRGKIVLLRRFALDQLSSSSQSLGLDLTNWEDNNVNFTTQYSSSPVEKAIIEDYYEPSASTGFNNHITAKYNAVQQHLSDATNASSKDQQLWITFSSGENDAQLLVPSIMALGDIISSGVNSRMKSYLTTLKGKRKGIVFTDWSAFTSGLIDAIIA